VVDIANGAKPVEVSRLILADGYKAHWTSWDAKTNRVVVTTSSLGRGRLYLVKLDPASGHLALDEAFRDTDGKVGFGFENKEWPHGWKGSGMPHGVVFSR
jgi:hypothetical protein